MTMQPYIETRDPNAPPETVEYEWHEAIHPYHDEPGEGHIITWHLLSEGERASVERFRRRVIRNTLDRVAREVDLMASCVESEKLMTRDAKRERRLTLRMFREALERVRNTQ